MHGYHWNFEVFFHVYNVMYLMHVHVCIHEQCTNIMMYINLFPFQSMNVASLQSKLDESQAKVESFNTQVATLQVCVYNVMYKYTCDVHEHVQYMYVCNNLSTCRLVSTTLYMYSLAN